MAKKNKTQQNMMPGISNVGPGFVRSALELERAKAVGRSFDAGAAYLDPIVSELNRQVEVTKNARAEFVDNLPDDFNFELVSAELKPKLTEFLSSKKSEFLKFADQASASANNPRSKQYMEAVEGMENAKSAMNNAYSNLISYKNKRQAAAENEDLIADYADQDGLNFSKRWEGIITGTNFDKINIQEDGTMIIDDGFGDATTINDLKDPYYRNTQASSTLNQLLLSNPYNDGAKGLPKDIVEEQLRQNLGAMFMNKDFAKEIYELGVFGDVTGKTKGSNIAQSPDQMIDAFINMAMENYDKGISKYNENNLNKGGRGSQLNKFGLKPDQTMFTLNTPQGQMYVDGRRIENTVETLRDMLDNGQGEFVAYNGNKYEYKNGSFSITTPTKEGPITTPDQNINDVINNLRLGDNKLIIDYLSPKQQSPDRLIPGLNPELEAALENYPGYASDTTFMQSGLYQDYTEGKLNDLLNDYVEMRISAAQEVAMTPAQGGDLDNIAESLSQSTSDLKKGDELQVRTSTTEGKTIVNGVEVDTKDWQVYDRFSGSLWNPSRWFRGNPNEAQKKAIRRIQDALKQK